MEAKGAEGGGSTRVWLAQWAALPPSTPVPPDRIGADGLCGPVAIVATDDGTIASVELLPLDTDPATAEADLQATHGGGVTRCYLLVPGFVDIHTHGRGGAEDMADFWLCPEYTTRTLPGMGTTSVLASMVFCCGQVDGLSSKAIQTYSHLAKRVGKTGEGAVIEGVHAEGPVVADLGGLPDSGCQRMSIERFTALLDAMSGCELKVMTIAPSIDAKDDYARIRLLLKRGILPALGHDRNCTEEEILGALRVAAEFGVTLHVTHLFNVCGFHHRLPSLCNFGLIPRFPSLPKYEGLTPPTVELIGDLAHVHPMTAQAVLAARDPADVAVITDSVMEPIPNLRKKYNGRVLTVTPTASAVYLEGTETLAGSCCSLLDAFASLTTTLGVSIGAAAQIVATTPARIARLDSVGAVEVGRRANFVLFTPNTDGQHGTHPDGWGDKASVDPRGIRHAATVVAGECVYTRTDSTPEPTASA